MDELLVFSNNKTGDKVGVYYNTWLFIIRCILVKYVHKTPKEVDEILKKQYFKKPEDYDDVIYIRQFGIRKFPKKLVISLLFCNFMVENQ